MAHSLWQNVSRAMWVFLHGGTNSGNLSITSACESPVNLLKFFDKQYDGENVMQLQYGPIGVYFKGMQELLKAYQDAYDRYKEAM